MEGDMYLGRTISALLALTDKTQTELAKGTDLRHATINSIINAGTRPHPANLGAICSWWTDHTHGTECLIAHLRDEIRDRAVDLPVHELYRRALKLKGDRKALLDHAKLMLQALIVAKQDRKALALIRESLQLDPTFSPFELEDAERLAQTALHGGQTDLALAMLKGLIDAHPRHVRLPHWALQASDLTLRRGEDPGRAKQWLSDAESLTADDELRRRLGAQRAALGL
jgi:transcriptional regulator with XRE-family HTH domain